MYWSYVGVLFALVGVTCVRARMTQPPRVNVTVSVATPLMSGIDVGVNVVNWPFPKWRTSHRTLVGAVPGRMGRTIAVKVIVVPGASARGRPPLFVGRSTSRERTT